MYLMACNSFFQQLLTFFKDHQNSANYFEASFSDEILSNIGEFDLIGQFCVQKHNINAFWRII